MDNFTEPKRMKISEEARTDKTSSDDQTTAGEEEQSPFSVKTWKEDLKLIVEGKAIYVNKAVLALISPVFETMFTANFKEKETDELELPGKSYDSFVNFLQCVYPGSSKQITAETVKEIIPLADEYQMLDLARCHSVFAETIRSTSSIDYIYTALKLSMLYNLGDTQTKCVKIASKQTLADIMANREKYEISSEVNDKILRHGFRRQELEIAKYKKQYEEVVLNIRNVLGDYYSNVADLKVDLKNTISKAPHKI